ncbi:hypothetical protein PDE_04383 [Penicillium oxalicum 114-2]|uniref:Apple domain-containing protein n=1 Tax=Penicillium oxalicum (strain 114-2 / CGMCC 5302) TaxID=933388 RepID=S7ZGN1_PENO1|nr:hypothetical protein PDE_04383 [Penicillium oxalicum 114-2]
MFSHWVTCALLALQLKRTSASASSLPCMGNVNENTITLFSHAPVTFSFEIPNASDCAKKCSDLASCRNWLFSISGKECQLYRDEPLVKAPNPLFVSGSCGKFSPSSSAIVSSSARHQPTPRSWAKHDRSAHVQHHRGQHHH